MTFPFSRKINDSVATPDYLYNLLNEEFDFDFDPCPLDGEVDGLSIDWGKTTFVNPPYSSIGGWVEKGVSWAKGGEDRVVVFLIPYRGTTRYWRKWVFPYSQEIRFMTKQVVFKGYTKNFPIPLVVAVFTSQSCKDVEGRKEKLVVTKEIIKKRTKATVSYFTLK